MIEQFSGKDRDYMRRALALARKGLGTVNPNPMVGAIIVKHGAVVGEGYHRVPGQNHAEINALQHAGADCAGSELYVTLEPCNHYGRTPPCTEAIISAGIKRVVFAARDPNPRVAGGGMERLIQAGLEVCAGLLEEEARELNRSFEKHATTGLPFVSLKVAATFDGKIATKTGASRWITGERARKYVHELRRRSDAILVGSGTVKADDPSLTVRGLAWRGARPPLRVILDSHLTSPPDAQVFTAPPETLIFTTGDHEPPKAAALRARGIEVVPVISKGERVDLHEVLVHLGKRDVVDLLVEGGAQINSSLIEQRLADRFYIFLAPKIFGGRTSPSWVAGEGIEDPQSCARIHWRRIRRIGEDMLIEAEPWR